MRDAERFYGLCGSCTAALLVARHYRVNQSTLERSASAGARTGPSTRPTVLQRRIEIDSIDRNLMTTRRQFLKLLGVGAVALATPSVSAAVGSDEKLDRICRHIGVFARKRNLRPEQIIAIDESGRLVFVASVHRAEIDGMFHIADRKLQYQEASV